MIPFFPCSDFCNFTPVPSRSRRTSTLGRRRPGAPYGADQEAGGVTQFTELVAKAGGIQTLMEIFGNAKVANNVRLVPQLLALPTVGDGRTRA
jgi:hypothetical protein